MEARSQNFEAQDLPFEVRLEIPQDPYEPIPNLEDGLAGMNFIDAAVRSSQKNGNN